MRKTGHILVGENFKASFSESMDKIFWKRMIHEGRAVFFNRAFSVSEASNSKHTHYETIFKTGFKQKPTYNPIAIIHIYANGSLEFYLDGIYLKGVVANMYEVLPIELENEYRSKQQRIIFNTEKIKKRRSQIIFPRDFNPNTEFIQS